MQNKNADYWRISSDYCKVDPEVAEHLGINEAIILRTIYGLSRWKKQNDGTEWFQGSRAYWVTKFKWISVSTFKRTIAKLQQMGLIEVRVDHERGNYFRPVHQNIEKMLERIASGRHDLNERSGQNEPQQGNESCQNEPITPCNLDRGLIQSEPTLLTFKTPNPTPNLSPNVCTDANVTVLADEKTENKTNKEPTSGSQIFEAYADAYQQRYKLEPLRNAKTNAVCASIAKQLPLDEAKAIMHFYLRQNVAWYVQKSHAIEYALKDLQALRTNMLRNQTMSSTAAQNADKLAAQKQALEKFHGQNSEIDESLIFGGNLCESDDYRAPLKLLRSKT